LERGNLKPGTNFAVFAGRERETTRMEDFRKQANDLLCYYGKMQNRLTQAGVNDTNSLVMMFAQLQRGLDAVAFEELDPAIQEVNRLVESLTRMQADLQVMRELKMRLGQLKNGASAENGNGNGVAARRG
jgi:hypothetical protein